ncbi:hypothetical protein LAUMK191_05219 [Mycobacterium attenuatum]|uniref:Uncharacterized protein n=1 Tax=Mycobacterium attenuatum TaxID=2341086 RepID=A0A498QDU0_9MYCO|nr:hypothetical protein LAUMK136_05242 [Mycobacterium attenuatum]VBA59864.1 hypothetical protein LAUMK191_05219 [Mycobacterium attenuatum]VBA61996.1 hypothetical protein LAUMK41_05382 [Mycobacterium attenuatum]
MQTNDIAAFRVPRQSTSSKPHIGECPVHSPIQTFVPI